MTDHDTKMTEAARLMNLPRFELIPALPKTQRAAVLEEIARLKRTYRAYRRQGAAFYAREIRDQEKIQYGFTMGLSLATGVSWFRVTDEFEILWDFARYASRVSEEPVWPVHQKHYARRTVAAAVKAKIIGGE